MNLSGCNIEPSDRNVWRGPIVNHPHHDPKPLPRGDELTLLRYPQKGNGLASKYSTVRCISDVNAVHLEPPKRTMRWATKTLALDLYKKNTLGVDANRLN
jgi:hypothetical protein